MRARFENLQANGQRSFRVVTPDLPRFDAPWHFHPEIELTLILESQGRRFVGDSVEPFQAGDLVLLGPNLPHFWHNDAPAVGRARAIVVQFRADFLGEELWTRPEFAAARQLCTRACRGLHFSGATTRQALPYLEAIPSLTGVRALMALWEVLDQLARADEARPLASAAYTPCVDAKAEDRMMRVHAFLMQHHSEPITLPEIARVAAMTPVAFSRYFKRTTGRNVSDFINDLRISHAAELLRDTSHSVTHIAADAGYPTLSNFFRRFRERFGCSPLVYRRDSDYAATPQFACN